MLFRTPFLILSLALVLFCNAAIAGAEQKKMVPLTLLLQGNSSVKTSKIKLSDIASCEGETETCKTFLTTDLLESPQAGHDRVYQMSFLRDLLRKTFKGSTPLLSGPEWIKVHAESQSIAFADIKSSLTQSVEARNKKSERVRLRLKQISSLETIAVRPGAYQIVFQDFEDDSSGVNDVSIKDFQRISLLRGRIHLVDGVEEDRAFTVSVHFAIEKKYIVSNKDLQVGQFVTASDIEEAWFGEAESSYDSLVNAGDAIGLSVVKPVAKNQLIRRTAIAKKVDVKRGQMVALSVQSSAIRIASHGRALQDGSAGDTISVLFPSTKKILQARVVGDSQVELEAN